MSTHYRITLNPTYASCKSFCERIDTYFDAEQESMHKARNEIKKIKFQEYSLVVKSFKVPHLLNQLVYTYFRSSKAHKSYDNALILQHLDINTPDPVALIQEFTPTLQKSFFISIAFDYDFTIREPLLDTKFKDRESIFQAFARFTADLHQKGVLHQDYSPGNILIKKISDEYVFSIVDINRMDFKAVGFETGCQNFSKLWADEDVLQIIADEYAKTMTYDQDKTATAVIQYDRKHKNFKLFKKKIKAMF